MPLNVPMCMSIEESSEPGKKAEKDHIENAAKIKQFNGKKQNKINA